MHGAMLSTVALVTLRKSLALAAQTSLSILALMVASIRVTSGSRSCLLSLLELLSLTLLGELSEQLEQGEKELTLLRAEVLTELLKLLHVLLVLL